MDLINGVQQAFNYFQLSPEEFFQALLTSTLVAAHPTAIMLKQNVSKILNVFIAAPDTVNMTSKWVF